MGVFLYDFNGTDTADGSGIPAPSGFPPLEQIDGAWRRLNNRAYTSTSRYNDPILAVTEGAGDCEISANIASGGGDCLYARIEDANNWIRLRTRYWRTSYSYTYYVTEYEIANVEGSPTQYEWRQDYDYTSPSHHDDRDGYVDRYNNHHLTLWNYSTSSPPSFPWDLVHSHYLEDEYYPGDQYNHEHDRQGSPYRTGRTSGGYYVSYYYWSTSSNPDGSGPDYWTGSTRSSPRTGTSYQYHHGLYLEKCVNGTVYTLDSVEIGAPTSLRLRCEGSQIRGYYNGSGTPAVSAVDSFNATVGRQGIGQGDSEYSSTALDNMQIDTLNTASFAPGIIFPADGAAVNRALDLTFQWAFGDPDVGDTQGGFDLEYRKVGDADWTLIHQDTADEFYVLAAYTLAVSTDYEWRVRTYDAEGAVGPWSPITGFTVNGYGQVIVSGQVKNVAEASVIVGGVKKPVSDITTIYGGAKKILA